MADLWMTSPGLDVSFEPENNVAETIKVSFGIITGQFISLTTENNQLVFKTSEVDKCFEILTKPPKSATISWGGKKHTVDWSNHNYKIEWIGQNTLRITVGENYEKQII